VDFSYGIAGSVGSACSLVLVSRTPGSTALKSLTDITSYSFLFQFCAGKRYDMRRANSNLLTASQPKGVTALYLCLGESINSINWTDASAQT